MRYLFSAKWILPVGAPALKNGAVAVEGDKIIAVGPAEILAADYPDAVARDFGRAIIMPGFVDLHTHLEFAAFRGVCDDLPYTQWKLQQIEKEKALDDVDWETSARLGAVEAVQAGITTIADVSPNGVGLKAAIEVGLRGLVYCELTGMDDSKVGEAIDEAKAKVAQWQEWAKGADFQIGVSPMSAHSACPTLIRATADWARAEGLKVCTHLAGSKDEYDFVKYGSSELAGAYREAMGWGRFLWQPTGVSPVRYLLQWGFFDNDVLAIHCVHVDDNDINVLVDHNVAVAHCPKCSAKLAMGTAPLRKFFDAGLRVGLGTDSPASNSMMDFFDEMRIGLLFQRGKNHTIDQAEAEVYVRMSTMGGAEALGLEASIGSLEPGKQADLIVVDMSHSHQRPLTDPYSAIVYTGNQQNVVLTMRAGKILLEDGEVRTVDMDQIIQDIEPVRVKLI